MQRIERSEGRSSASEDRLRDLLLRGLAGEAPAYHAFLQELSAHLRAFLRKRLVRLPDEVEDLLQESLLAVHNQRHTYDADQPLTAWVYAIAKYKLVDLLRRRANRDLLTDPLDEEIDVFSSADADADAAEARLAWVPGALAAPVLAMWILAIVVLTSADPATRAGLFFGDTWAACPLLVALLSAPVFVAVVWAMKGLAPTRLRFAGAAAGLLSGTVGALVYSLQCPELAAPFLGFWYLLGMLIPTVVGALLGDRLLRW